MKITLRQLEVFTAVASEEGVTRAADKVGLTQAATSMALADLERMLDVSLFDRVGRQLRINDVGRLLWPRAQEVLDRVHDIETLAQGGTLDLHLGASVTIGNHLLPAVIATLKARFPNCRIQVSRFNTEQVVEQLLAFGIDLGFIEGPVHHAELRHFPWRNDRLAIFAAAAHPLAGRSLAPADLAEESWIVRERGSGTREVFDHACSAQGLAPNVLLELEQPEAIRQCVRAGLGIGCLSTLELEDVLQTGQCVRLDVPLLDMPRALHVVTHRHKYLSVGLRSVLDVCGISAG